jgi:hypothetical protein
LGAASYSACAHADEAALYRAAKAEGKVVWYTTLIYDTAVRPLIAAFEKTYPGVHVEFSRADSVPTALKILQRRQTAGRRLRRHGNGGAADPRRRRGEIRAPNDADYPAQLKDPNGYWRSFILYFLTPAVNTDQVSPSERPRAAQDLLDPKWKARSPGTRRHRPAEARSSPASC